MKNKNLINQYKDIYNGQTVTVSKFKTKDKKVINNTRSNFINCPNCLSKMVVNESGLQKCSGDKLDSWDKEFTKFDSLSDDKKLEYIKNITEESMFFELYDRWKYCKTDTEDTFSCGYTNKIFLAVPNCSVIIPDPTQMIRIERKLGRKLTEEEIFGEKELFVSKGGVFEEYRKGAKTLKIILLRFPEDCY